MDRDDVKVLRGDPFSHSPTRLAAEAIWHRLDPQDEIGQCGTMPMRFFEAAELVIEAYLRATKGATGMGEEKAVKKSTGQEELVIAPEAAGLETRCAQPSPASDTWCIEHYPNKCECDGRRSEIRYVRDSDVDVDLLTLIAVMIERADNDAIGDATQVNHAEVSDWGEHLAKRVLFALQPYLRTMVPVSVSLEKCAREIGYDPSDKRDLRKVAKAVLESAKTQGARFDVQD
jgi:hypothetical protein